MSQHKTGLSNWTAEDKKLYWQRRNKGLRGQLGHATVFETVKDGKGEEQLVPVGVSASSVFSRGKQSDARTYKRQQSRAMVRQQRRTTGRGE